MQALLKYRGGKRREIKFFEEYFPEDFDVYIEPFIGGGAVYFHLEPQKAIINDINKPLIEFYKGLRGNYDQVTKDLNELSIQYKENRDEFDKLKIDNPDKLIEDKNEDLYYKIRDMYNSLIDKEYTDAALYYFINKTAYSGMIRYNSNGEFNVPYGRYKNFKVSNITTEHKKLLNKTKIYCKDFEEIIKMAGPNDFIFLDPPYDTVFKDYGNITTSFGEEEHKRLAKVFKESEAKIMLIISRTPLIMDLYSDYIKGSYDKKYAVNIRNRFESEAKHLIITNY